MTLIPIIILCVLCIAGAPLHARQKPGNAGTNALLLSLKNYDDMVRREFPKSYSVPVDLSGDIADEMKQTIHGLGLSAPQYKEVLDKDGMYRLTFSNADYPLQTRDLLSGILNPVEIMNTVLANFLKYRNPQMFSALVDETTILTTRGIHDSLPSYSVTLLPRGTRFNYSSRDNGAYIEQTWLTRAVVIIDSSTSAVNELLLEKKSRRISADALDGPPVDSTSTKYAFEYGTINGKRFPVMLRLFVNNALVLTLSATYRVEEKKCVFDTRTLCYRTPQQKKSCLMFYYGAYSFHTIGPPLSSQRSAAQYSAELKKAAGISYEITLAFKKGDIARAQGLLKELVDRFPQTPQGVEARKLLNNVPSGF